MLDLANYLIGPYIAGGKPAYNAVCVYDYNWFTPIKDSGDTFTADLRRVMGSRDMEIWAHNMGGLVAWQAIEKDAIGDTVHRQFTLGTPHEGLPAGASPRAIGTLSGMVMFR